MKKCSIIILLVVTTLTGCQGSNVSSWLSESMTGHRDDWRFIQPARQKQLNFMCPNGYMKPGLHKKPVCLYGGKVWYPKFDPLSRLVAVEMMVDNVIATKGKDLKTCGVEYAGVDVSVESNPTKYLFVNALKYNEVVGICARIDKEPEHGYYRNNEACTSSALGSTVIYYEEGNSEAVLHELKHYFKPTGKHVRCTHKWSNQSSG